MTIVIPTWVLWTLTGVAGLVVLGLAVLGLIFMWVFKDGIGYWR